MTDNMNAAKVTSNGDGTITMDKDTFDALVRVLLTGSERPNVGGWTYCDGTDVADARARLDAAGVPVSRMVREIHDRRRARRAARA